MTAGQLGGIAARVLQSQAVRASLLTSFAQAASAALGLISLLLLSRLVSPALLGQTMTAIALVSLLSIAASMNVEAGAIRFLSTPDRSAQRRHITWSRKLILGASFPLGGIAAFWGLGYGGGTPGAVAAMAILVPLVAAVRMTARHGSVLGHPVTTFLPRLFARPVAFLAVSAAILWAGLTPDMAHILLGWAAVLGVALTWQLVSLPLPAADSAKSPEQPSLWLGHGMKLIPSLLILEYLREFVTLSAAVGLPPGDIAAMGIAFSLATIPGFLIGGVEIGHASALSTAWQSGRIATARVLRRIALLRLGAGVVGVCLLGLVQGPLLAWIGPGYHGVSALLMPAAAIQLVRCLVGNPVQLLSLTGHPGLVMRQMIWGLPLLAFGIAVAALTGRPDLCMWAAALGYGALYLRLRGAALRTTGLECSCLTVLPLARVPGTSRRHGGTTADPLRQVVRGVLPAHLSAGPPDQSPR